jgi:transposase
MIFIVFLDVENFIFVDESGVNEHGQRDRARALRGVRVHGTKPGKRPKKTNVIAGLWNKKHIAVRCYTHNTTSAFFEDWFEWELLSIVPKGSAIIFDNASFHRKKHLAKIAERYGVYLLFLPPYSPDYNPIEKSWANLKRWLIGNLEKPLPIKPKICYDIIG